MTNTCNERGTKFFFITSTPQFVALNICKRYLNSLHVLVNRLYQVWLMLLIVKCHIYVLNTYIIFLMYSNFLGKDPVLLCVWASWRLKAHQYSRPKFYFSITHTKNNGKEIVLFHFIHRIFMNRELFWTPGISSFTIFTILCQIFFLYLTLITFGIDQFSFTSFWL